MGNPSSMTTAALFACDTIVSAADTRVQINHPSVHAAYRIREILYHVFEDLCWEAEDRVEDVLNAQVAASER